MLRKLIKHEYIATSKAILPLYLLLAILTVFGRIVTFVRADSVPLWIKQFCGFSTIGYVFGLLCIYVAALILVFWRFDKSMFSHEGYLTHTLPVSPAQLLCAKAAVAFSWLFLTSLLTGLSLCCAWMRRGSWKAITDAIQNYGGLDAFCQDYFGMRPVQTVLTLLVIAAVTWLYLILMAYASICIGQLWQKHGIMGTFLAFYALFILTQALQLGLSRISFAGSNGPMPYFPLDPYVKTYASLALLCVLCFATSAYILKKKLNLE